MTSEHLDAARSAAAEATYASLDGTDMDDLEPRLVRHGYDTRAVAELIGANPGEVRSLLQGRLEEGRVRELTEQMMAAGLPV